MKHYITLFFQGALFIALIFFVCCTSSSKKDQEKIHLQLMSEVETINKQCPIFLTSYVRLDSCILRQNNDIANYYTLSNPQDFTQEKLEMLEKEVRHQVKVDPGMAQIRSYGITIQYMYFDSERKPILSFDITSADYNK